ncbi:MAG: hypothetical protein ACPGNV_16870 [Mangrovicoccus sp.]
MLNDPALAPLLPGLGVFVGVAITMGLRKRAGRTEGLVKGSVLATALIAAFMTMAVISAFKAAGI